MRALTHISLAVVLAPGAALAQGSGLLPRFESRSTVGAFLPTGEQRDLLEESVLTGGQLAYRVHRNVSIVGAVGMSRSRDQTMWRAGGAGPLRSDERVNLYQYDLGVEGRLPERLAVASWAVSPFASVGIGGRTYDYRNVEGTDTETNLVGYAGAGAELGPRGARWALRFEARDHVSSFGGLRGELPEHEARNDLALTAGLRLRLGGR